MLVQTLAVLIIRKPTRRYTLGLFIGVSCVFILGNLLYHDKLLAEDPALKDLGPPEVTALRFSQLTLTLAAAFASISIPRRPRVFKDGGLVDGMHTGSAFGRYTFSWVSRLLALAREEKTPQLGGLAQDEQQNSFSGPQQVME